MGSVVEIMLGGGEIGGVLAGAPLLAAGGGLALVEVSAALLGLLGLLVVVSRRVRRSGTGQGARRVVALSNQHALHWVELGGKRLLIGTGPTGAPRLVCEFETEPESDSAMPPGGAGRRA